VLVLVHHRPRDGGSEGSFIVEVGDQGRSSVAHGLRCTGLDVVWLAHLRLCLQLLLKPSSLSLWHCLEQPQYVSIQQRILLLLMLLLAEELVIAEKGVGGHR